MKRIALKNSEIHINDINFEKLIRIYSMALRKVKILLEELKERINNKEENKTIKDITVRIKATDSIIDKMIKKGYSLTYQTLIEKINDIAGARVICESEEDVYRIAKEIENIKAIRILNSKDYIKNPKESGYSAYHIIVEVPINIKNNKIFIKVEIQIRTLSMDYWANIEHDISYKRNIMSIRKRLEV